jgi:hypothetical protein
MWWGNPVPTCCSSHGGQTNVEKHNIESVKFPSVPDDKPKTMGKPFRTCHGTRTHLTSPSKGNNIICILAKPLKWIFHLDRPPLSQITMMRIRAAFDGQLQAAPGLNISLQRLRRAEDYQFI